MYRILTFIVSICFIACGQKAQEQTVEVINTKVHVDTKSATIHYRFNVPIGYERIRPDSSSFGLFLQALPLKSEGSPVMLYNGEAKANQKAHVAVLDLNIGSRDLQQCADAVMRLRADYLYVQRRFEEIAFNFVSDGKPRYFIDYCNQKRDSVCYRKYLDYVFNYANTRSLRQQLQKVELFSSIGIGDVIIQQGNPFGHAVIVVDMAINQNTGEKIFMLAQSYMPAQDIHVLKNPIDDRLSPWYEIPEGNDILTPEWRFEKEDLRRF